MHTGSICILLTLLLNVPALWVKCIKSMPWLCDDFAFDDPLRLISAINFPVQIKARDVIDNACILPAAGVLL